MVAKVISGQNIKGALNYNEQKVMEGKATCIQANLFTRELDALDFYTKLSRFTDLNERNQRTKTNTLHISLNFDVGEKLATDVLNQVASTYMDKIGFGEQPYLVYEHDDAAHPHVHIVTTLIKEDGKRIPIHYLGKNESEKARMEIENEFGLVRAQSKVIQEKAWIQQVDVQKAVYGKSETKRTISNIVRMVTRSYKYSSLPELNAILLQFNVFADRGSEKSKMFEKRGLMYSLLDEKGNRIGIPIKASAIYGKPTLAFLEKQFKLNAVLREGAKASLSRSIDQVIQTNPTNSKDEFKSAMEKKGITVLFRANSEGRTYGVTLVDNKAQVVFNGSDLGKAYSAKAILQRLLENKTNKASHQSPEATPSEIRASQSMNKEDSNALGKTTMDLNSATDLDHSSPEAALRLRRNKRKRRKR